MPLLDVDGVMVAAVRTQESNLINVAEITVVTSKVYFV